MVNAAAIWGLPVGLLLLILLVVSTPVMAVDKRVLTTQQKSGECLGCRTDLLAERTNVDGLKKMMPRVLEAIERLESRDDDAHAALLVRIEVAEGQIVSGRCYYLQLLVGESECTRGEKLAGDGSAANCAVERDGSERQRYVVGIYEQSWGRIFDLVLGDDISTVGCGHGS